VTVMLLSRTGNTRRTSRIPQNASGAPPSASIDPVGEGGQAPALGSLPPQTLQRKGVRNLLWDAVPPGGLQRPGHRYRAAHDAADGRP